MTWTEGPGHVSCHFIPARRVSRIRAPNARGVPHRGFGVLALSLPALCPRVPPPSPLDQSPTTSQPPPAMIIRPRAPAPSVPRPCATERGPRSRARGWLLGGVVGCVLLAQLLPVLAALGGTIGHAAEHLTSTMAAEHRRNQVEVLQALERLTLEDFLHAHGEGSLPHTHSPAIQLALTFLAEGETDSSPSNPTPLPIELRVDRHLTPGLWRLESPPAMGCPCIEVTGTIASPSPAPPTPPPPRL